jgi:predicted kinase
MLIVLAGLPGTGKTTIARKLAGMLPAVHLRIDSIEQALRAAGIADDAMGASGYAAAFALAADNLALGQRVIADAVNPVREAREAWRNVALRAGASLLEVELICSQRYEHRRRVESRTADIEGHRLPDWPAVEQRHYEAWDREHLAIDTAARTPEQVVAVIVSEIARMQGL